MHSGQPVPVQAWNREFNKKIATGKLLTFDNEIDQTTGTVKLRAHSTTPIMRCFRSQFVNASLLIKTVQDAVLVPLRRCREVRREVSSTWSSPTARWCSADHGGPTQGDLSAIKSGLSAGEKVVTDGVDKLQPGTKVAAA